MITLWRGSLYLRLLPDFTGLGPGYPTTELRSRLRHHRQERRSPAAPCVGPCAALETSWLKAPLCPSAFFVTAASFLLLLYGTAMLPPPLPQTEEAIALENKRTK